MLVLIKSVPEIRGSASPSNAVTDIELNVSSGILLLELEGTLYYLVLWWQLQPPSFSSQSDTMLICFPASS